jgi:hypothetical protein
MFKYNKSKIEVALEEEAGSLLDFTVLSTD